MTDMEVGALDISEQIEVAKASLERINGWIDNCDTKAGTILALIGVLLTIVFTNEGLNELYKLMSRVFPPRSFCGFLYLLLFVSSVILLIIGLLHLIWTLMAVTDAKKYSQSGVTTNSLLHFKSISDRTDYQRLYDDFITQSKESYLNDLMSQVYINSIIANKKYENYNNGLRYTIEGFIAFIIMFLLGLYLY